MAALVLARGPRTTGDGGGCVRQVRAAQLPAPRGDARRRPGGPARLPVSAGAGAPARRLTPKVRQRGEVRLDLLAQILEVGRQRELFAEGFLGLIGREAGAFGRDLEQDATRLPEVGAAVVEAVDHGGRVFAPLDHAVAPALVVGHGRGPRDVVHGACTAEAAMRWSFVIDVVGAAVGAARFV